MNTIKLIISISVLTCAGCIAPGPSDYHYGETMAYNKKASVVNPAGHAPTVSTLDGKKASQVVDAYIKESGDVSDERLVKDVGAN